MEDNTNQETSTDDIEEVLEDVEADGSPSPKKEKKVDMAALSYFGETFTGYQKLAEIQDLIPAFKDAYYTAKVADPKVTLSKVIKEFNKEIDKNLQRKFHPYTSMIRRWRTKWDKDIFEKQGMHLTEITTKKHVQQVLKTRAQGDDGLVKYSNPTYDDLEQATQSLGGELINDAMQMLRNDQEMEDIYESDELVKRKTYVINVFAHVTKLVQGKAALLLKASQEKRENAGFLMELMNKASSGKMGIVEINGLRQSYEDAKRAEEFKKQEEARLKEFA